MKGSNRWAVGMVLAVSGSALAGDFNLDGFDDVAIGAPNENVAAVADGGAVTILYGSAGGIVGLGSVQITLNTAGVPGSAATSDRFGAALAIGRFNGDNFPDLAVGVPGKTIGGEVHAGEVVILFGSQQGLSGTGSQVFHQNSAGVADKAEAGDFFGSALAAGDFNGDGIDDLAVGINYEDIGAIQNAGAVAILYGSASGLTATGSQLWNQNSTGIRDSSEKDDYFGFSLAVGDFQNDGYDDLAIGVPYEDLGADNQGAVNVIYGTASGLASTGNQFWSQDSTGISGVGNLDDRFGRSLAAGAFGNGDGDDLAVGVPFEDSTFADAGAINMIYGSPASGLRSKANNLITQDTSGIPDAEEADDLFGWSLAAGRTDTDDFDDLVIGSPYEDVDNIIDAGAVIVLCGSAGGIGPGSNFLFNQDIGAMQDSAEIDDHFGYSVAATEGKSINGDDRSDIVVGIPDEEVSVIDCGFFAVIFGSAAGPTDAGNQLISENTPGVAGTAEAYDQWGLTVGAR